MEVLHLSYIVEEMGDSMGLPLEIKVDNTTAIAFSKGNVRRSKLKHIDVRQSWVEWLRDKSLVNLSHVESKLNLAGFFTKLLDLENFTRLRSMVVVDRPIDLALRARLWRDGPARTQHRYVRRSGCGDNSAVRRRTGLSYELGAGLRVVRPRRRAEL